MNRNICALALVCLSAAFTSGCNSVFPAKPENQAKIEKPQSRTTPGLLELDEQKEKLAEIKTTKVTRQALEEKLELCSTVEAPANQTGAVYSLVSGVVTRVLADVGDRVKAGQVLAYINSPDLAEAQSSYLHALAKLDEVIAEERLVRTRLALSEADEKRAAMLNDEGITSRRELDSTRAKVAATKAELVAAANNIHASEAQLSAAKMRLKSLGLGEPSRDTNVVTSELALRSPVNGIVVSRNINPGQSAGPNFTSASKTNALLTVADLKTVWVMLEVPQSEIAKLKLHTAIEFKSEVAPGMTFLGRVTKLGENFDPNSHTAMVRTEIANPSLILKPGMMIVATATNKILGDSALTVPSSAVQTIENKTVVFKALGNHCYKQVEVEIGSRLKDVCEVKSGLSEGDSVVSQGAFYLKTEEIRNALSAGQGG